MGDTTDAGTGAAKDTTTTTDVTDTTKTGQGEGGTGFDTKSIKDDDFTKVFDDPRLFNHPRFKSLNDQAKQARILQEEKANAEKAKLAEEKKFEELAKKNADETQVWKSRAETSTINSEIIREASKQGVVDADAVVKLIDRKEIKLNEDGTVTGVAEAVKSLIADKKYLVGKGGTQRIGGGTAPSDQDTTTPRFKLSQLKDVAFFRKHEKEIGEAMRLNLVIDDVSK